MRRLLLATAALLALASPSQADVVLGAQNWTSAGNNLTLQAVVPSGNQPQNIQCIICGDNQPQQSATFGYTNFQNTGNDSNLLYFSTNVSGGGNPGADTVGLPYDLSFLQAYLLANGGGTLNFSVGIDVNDTNVPQTLESFYMLNFTTHTVLASFVGPALLPNINNGTGFPDFTLTGFNLDLGSDIHVGDQIIFFARISNASDGPDSFFLTPSVQAVPGPIVGAGIPGLLAACFGLLGLNWHRKRRNA